MSKSEITMKQEIVLLLLYIFRFLNSKQIQEFLHHKDHRRINSWLKELTEKGYIHREFTPVFGILTKPAIYNLSSLGIKYIKKNYAYSFPRYLKRISRDRKASKGFKIKCQLLADWYLMLFSPTRRDNINREKETEKKDSKMNDEKDCIHTGIAIADYLISELTTDGKIEKIPLNTSQFFTPS